jgi:rubrerythrin
MNTIKTRRLIKALEELSSDDISQVARGLTAAIRMEKESVMFYSKHAEKASNRDFGAFFLWLAEQEREHYRVLSRLKKSLKKSGSYEVTKLSAKHGPKLFTKEELLTEHEDSITPILFALWKEKQAEEFYIKASKKVKAKPLKRLFKALARFEREHAEYLEEYVEHSFYSRELIMG